MNLTDFLIQLKEQRILLSLNEGRLSVRGNKDGITAKIKADLQKAKENIIVHFERLGISGNSQLAPVTLSQQRLVIIDRMEPGSALYNMQAVLRLKGVLHEEAVHWAFQRIYERHDILRTRFHTDGELAYQVVHPPGSLNIYSADLSEFAPGEKQAQLEKLISEEAQAPFNLQRDPLLRPSLIKLSEREHVLLYSLHHIASDGWSMGVLLNEFNSLYQAFVAGEGDPLPPLDIQYADYAHWQRNWLKGEVLQAQLDYWQRQLAGIPEVHKLPLDKPRPAAQSYRGGVHRSCLDKSVADAFLRLCRERDATLFMGLHAAFSLLLSFHSGEQDIVMGTPAANREQTELAPLIGYFLNTLVLRSDLSRVGNFLDLLAQSKETALAAYAHQQVPFEQLLKTLGIENSLSHAAIFQIMLILQSNDRGTLAVPGLEVIQENPDSQQSKVDLTLSVIESERGLLFGWEHNRDIFDTATIARLAERFSLLLESIVASPNSPLTQHELLTAADKAQLLSWRGEGRCAEIDIPVHAQIEQQAQARPGHCAVQGQGVQLSYSELNRRANQLARYLVSAGARKGELVGICLPRSPDLLVAILAVLKAGAAYLPLDEGYPHGRLSAICRESNLKLLLTHTACGAAFPGVERLHLDDTSVQAALFALSGEDITDVNVGLDHLAYVIYTSGSTGQPKGVMVSHGNLASYLSAAISQYRIDATDRVLQFSSPSFDIFVEEAFLALVSGASLVLRDDELLGGGRAFWRFICQQGVSFASLPTAFWHQLANQLDSANTPDTGELHTLVLGGEAMSEAALERWQHHLGRKVRLINTYGPTEGTVVATAFDLRESQGSPWGIPIGKPIANTRCHVLDASLNPCPPGVVGELYLSGPGVAQGYLNQPSLTSERFLPAPWEPASTLYKTGDLVRYLDDGNLIFVGRRDDQVKIRGFRIELKEVEHQLAKLPGVQSCYVTTDCDSAEHKRLVAYVVAEEQVTEQALRESMRGLLPEYMLPSGFMFIEALPLTPNGKVDGKALPGFQVTTREREPLQGEVEVTLANCWALLLGVDSNQIGADANFFDLGGHSLLAIRLVAEIQDEFDVELGIKQLFELRDLRALAQVIEQLGKQRALSAQLSTLSEDSLEEVEF